MRHLMALMMLPLLGSCGSIAVNEARDPLSSKIIGMSFQDLIACMGIPDAHMDIGGNEAIAQWNASTADGSFKVATPIGISIDAAGGGSCKAVIRINDDGTVEDVAFAGRHTVNIAADPSTACGSLVSECVSHPSSTQLPVNYHALELLDKSSAVPKPAK